MIRTVIFPILLLIAFNSHAQEPPKEKKAPPQTVIKTQKKPIDRVQDSIYYDRTKQKKLDGMYIPMDLYDCFRVLDQQMSETAKEQFKSYSDEEVDRKTHGTLGFWMEHKWSISEGSRLTEYFRKMGVPHYDYMIGIIIQSYHRHLNGKDLKVREQVDRFKAMWEKKQQAKAAEIIKKGEVKSGQ